MKKKYDDVTVAMTVVTVLACCKNASIFPDHIKWQLNAYTNWNVILFIIRHLLSIQEWDQFLCVNSIGIWLGFRTAFAQGLDDNIRKKLCKLGLKLSRFEFILGDFITHTFPALITSYTLIHKKKTINSRAVTYALTLSTWFVYRQVGKLDASDIYVPHPWRRGWFGVIIGMMCAPSLIDACQNSKKYKLLMTLLIMSVPLLSTHLDKNLKRNYDLEYVLPKTFGKLSRSRSDNSLKSMSNRLTYNS